MSDERLEAQTVKARGGAGVRVRTVALLTGTLLILLAARPLFRAYFASSDIGNKMAAVYGLVGLWLFLVASAIVLLVKSFSCGSSWRMPFRVTGGIHALLGLAGFVWAVVEED